MSVFCFLLNLSCRILLLCEVVSIFKKSIVKSCQLECCMTQTVIVSNYFPWSFELFLCTSLKNHLSTRTSHNSNSETNIVRISIKAAKFDTHLYHFKIIILKNRRFWNFYIFRFEHSLYESISFLRFAEFFLITRTVWVFQEAEIKKE